MERFSCLFLLSLCILMTHARVISNLQTRDFDLHSAMRLAYDHDHLTEQLGKATVDEVKGFMKSIAEDCADIEALSTKLLQHDWTSEPELTSEEHELIYHILVMDSYLPNVGDAEGPGLFLDDCKQEYMATDFSEKATFEEAQMEAMVQVLTCGFNGFRVLEKVLDIGHLNDAQLKDVSVVAKVLEELARGVREMFTLGRFFDVISNIDGSAYTTPESFNDALKADAVAKMDEKRMISKTNNAPKKSVTVSTGASNSIKLDARKVSSVSRALDNIREVKNKMLLERLLRALKDKSK